MVFGCMYPFKAGLVGVVAFCSLVPACVRAFWQLLRRVPEIALAALPSLVLGLLAYTPYNYLCMGALLVLLRVAAKWGRLHFSLAGRPQSAQS